MPVPFETVALNVAVPPLHIVTPPPLTDTVGSATTVTVAVVLVSAPQPTPV